MSDKTKELLELILQSYPAQSSECIIHMGQSERRCRCDLCTFRVQQWDALAKIIPKDQWPKKEGWS